MYRDNTLIPTEAIRLAALGTLARQPMRYGELARDVRAFASRITGPSLDLLGTSIELLRFEGLVEPVNGESADDSTLLRLTAAGQSALMELLSANVRSPVDGVAKLILALKLRFLHLLPAVEQREQIDRLIEMSETERARLVDLRQRYGHEDGCLDGWLEHDITQVSERITWLQGLGIDLKD